MKWSKDWREIRMKVAERDNYKCVLCGKTAKGGQVHHLIYRKAGGTNELSNLINLCGLCHMLESYTPDFAVHNAFKVPLKEIPQERKRIRGMLTIIIKERGLK